MSGDQTEFSRVFKLDELDEGEIPFDLSANEEERAALAKRFELPAIESLRASGTLKRLRGGRVRLRAALRADVTQTCVVSLDPIDNRIEEDLEILFEPARGRSDDSEIAFDPDSDREPLIGDSLDVGEVVAEEFALALDPYPRKPGIALEIEGDEKAENQGQGGPFEALAALKQKG
jgi:uncharacterized metal-binding protein YceD (DUF177 family)